MSGSCDRVKRSEREKEAQPGVRDLTREGRREGKEGGDPSAFSSAVLL